MFWDLFNPPQPSLVKEGYRLCAYLKMLNYKKQIWSKLSIVVAMHDMCMFCIRHDIAVVVCIIGLNFRKPSGEIAYFYYSLV